MGKDKKSKNKKKEDDEERKSENEENKKNDPILKQIESLKQILKTQKQRLSKEKNKLQKNEDNNENINIGNEIKRLQSIDAQRFGKSKPVKPKKQKMNREQQNALEIPHKLIKPEEHGHVFTDYMKKLKDGLLMHQTLKTAEHAVVKIKHALSDQLELEKARNKQMFGQQYAEEND